MSFCSVLLESTVITFWLVNREVKVFLRKVNLRERSVSYSKMNTLLFCAFTFRVDCEMYSFFFANEKYFCLGEDEQLGSFRINTTT